MSTKLGDSFINEQAVNFLTRDGWVNWTPTINQGGAVARTVNYARWCVMANTVFVIAKMTVTGAGVGANAVEIGGIPAAVQPANAGSVLDVIGTIVVLDSGTIFYQGALVATAAAGWQGIVHNGGQIGVLPNFALAANDVVGIQACYER